MITLSQLLVKLNNLVQIGTIHESKILDGQHLARVILDDDGINKRVSPFIPVKSLANSFGRAFFPIRSGEQVIVISPFGNINGGFIIRSIFHKKCQLPSGANENIAVIEFEDGTRFSYDTKNKKLIVSCVNEIDFIAKKINIKAENTNFDGGAITHNGTPIDDTHDHTQKTGDHFGAGGITTPPNKKA
ncbi:hypothetical protein [Arcobacter sp.]|uniref:hypothetical protein n=1 Tax=unclassified Arcobacter TaxID=2593671 RepID=UPI003B00F4CD